MFLLAVSLRGCVTYEFEHEFWLKTDGSGSFVVTAPPWVWNAVKNVGQATNLDATVNEETVGALFQNPAFLRPRVKRVTRAGRPYITVAADFLDVNALIGTKAFPDLALALRPEGGRLRLFGVWRRPALSGTAQGDDNGLMAVRFHLPSEIFSHRNASMGIERGNILSWRQDLSAGIAGSPIDLGAVVGTRSVLSATLGIFGMAVLSGVSLMAVVLYLFARRGRRRRRPSGTERSGETGSHPDFLNYDPSDDGQ